jgi:clan AA aspartic protease (TIGR02281 family)
VNRILLALVALIVAAGVAAYGDPVKLADIRHSLTVAGRDVTGSIGLTAAPRGISVDIGRGRGGQFSVRATVNGLSVPMMIDTGASSVVLTYETAKAAGLPLELLDYDVDLETASGRIKGARLTLHQLAIGKLVEHSLPAIVMPQGELKSNLLGMSFLDRLESWEVRGDRLVLRGYP